MLARETLSAAGIKWMGHRLRNGSIWGKCVPRAVRVYCDLCLGGAVQRRRIDKEHAAAGLHRCFWEGAQAVGTGEQTHPRSVRVCRARHACEGCGGPKKCPS